MNGPEHYAKAERLLSEVNPRSNYGTQAQALIQLAQVHATLARSPGDGSLVLIRELLERLEKRGGCTFMVNGQAWEVRTDMLFSAFEPEGVPSISLKNLQILLDAESAL